jgi:hypothetical protein
MSETRVTSRLLRAAALVGVVTLVVTACMSSGGRCAGALVGASPASASCAAGVEYDGRFYTELSSRLPVAKGRALGAAVYPPCNDTGGCVDAGRGRPTQVWAMRGVDSDTLIVARREGGRRLVVMAVSGTHIRHFFRFSDGAWHLRTR